MYVWICTGLVQTSVFVATDGVSIHTLIWVFATSYSHCFARFEYKLQSLLQQMHAFGQSCGLGQHLALDGRNSAGKISFAFRKNVWTHLSRWGVWRCGHVMWYRYIKRIWDSVFTSPTRWFGTLVHNEQLLTRIPRLVAQPHLLWLYKSALAV